MNSEVKNISVLSGQTHCREIIQNLWTMLGDEVDTEEIVHRLKAFDLLLPSILSGVIIEDLQGQHNRARRDAAIKKFSTFWKYTA